MNKEGWVLQEHFWKRYFAGFHRSGFFGVRVKWTYDLQEAVIFPDYKIEPLRSSLSEVCGLVDSEYGMHDYMQIVHIRREPITQWEIVKA